MPEKKMIVSSGSRVCTVLTLFGRQQARRTMIQLEISTFPVARTSSTFVQHSLSMDLPTSGTPTSNPEVRVHAGANLDILDAGQSPNAVSVHAGTSKVDFKVDRPPPAACPPGDLLITMVKEKVILFRKEFRKMNDLKVMKTRHDC